MRPPPSVLVYARLIPVHTTFRSDAGLADTFAQRPSGSERSTWGTCVDGGAPPGAEAERRCRRGKQRGMTAEKGASVPKGHSRKMATLHINFVELAAGAADRPSQQRDPRRARARGQGRRSAAPAANSTKLICRVAILREWPF